MAPTISVRTQKGLSLVSRLGGPLVEAFGETIRVVGGMRLVSIPFPPQTQAATGTGSRLAATVVA